MIKLEEFEKVFNSKMPCRWCDGTGINDWKKQKTVTVYGMTLKEIMEMWRFAKEHGYQP